MRNSAAHPLSPAKITNIADREHGDMPMTPLRTEHHSLSYAVVELIEWWLCKKVMDLRVTITTYISIKANATKYSSMRNYCS